MQQITDEDVAKLYTLTLRLLTSSLDESSQHAQLLVGQLPEGFPKEIPLPPGTNVIGSFFLPLGNIKAIFEVAMPSHEVLTFYRQALAEVGKELGIAAVPRSRELLQRWHDINLRFRLNQSWKDVIVTAAPLSSDLTDLRLNIHSQI